ncbi:MAG: hypothetical protein L6284_05325 [Brevundimonas sp.]|jgi:hypothetical protein|nr:hypothetical protein [Brevundimonas sp.]
MPHIDLPTVGAVFVDVFWTTPGGAGGTRTATVRLGYTALSGFEGFTVDLPDDGNGREDVLRHQAYVAILPALRRLRLTLDRDPASIGAVRRMVAKRMATVGFEVASEDGKRRAFFNQVVPVRDGETDEDLILKVSGRAFRFIDSLTKDLEALVGPAA